MEKYKPEKVDLQIFAGETAAASTTTSPINGDKIVFYYRLLKNETTKAASLIAFQTEGGETLSRDSDTTATKSGPVVVPGALETEISVTALVEKGGAEEKELREALINGDKVEMWKANLGREGTETTNEGKYYATYYQGVISQFELSADADDFANYQLTFKGEGTPKDGYVTVSKEEAEALSYAFRDLAKVTSA